MEVLKHFRNVFKNYLRIMSVFKMILRNLVSICIHNLHIQDALVSLNEVSTEVVCILARRKVTLREDVQSIKLIETSVGHVDLKNVLIQQ